MTERVTSSSVPVRASGEPQIPDISTTDLEYAANLIEGRIPREGPEFRSLLRGRVHRIRNLNIWLSKYGPYGSASPSDDGARQPQETCPVCSAPIPCPYETMGVDEIRHLQFIARLRAAASDDGAAREPQDVPRFALRLVEKYSPEGVFQSVDLKRERHEHGEWVRWEDVEAELAAARARIVVLETSVDSLRYLIDHPVTQEERP